MNPLRSARLRQGDQVAVIAPSSPLLDTGGLDAGVEVLRAWGLSPTVLPHVYDAEGHLAGSDEARAADLNLAIANPAVRAIFVARGGYGLTRILHRVDWQALADDPKLLVGFSDTTALLVAVWQRIGLVGIHGPFAAHLHRLAPFARTHLRRVLTNRGPIGALAAPPEAGPIRGLVAGRAEGPLVGGNLSLLAALAGTRHAVDLRGEILLIEEVNEAPYRLDRKLTQLRTSGGLDGVAAVIVGQMVGCEPPEDRPSAGVRDVLIDRLGDLGVPVITGLAAGHVDHQLALPLGVRVRVDGDAGRVEFLDPHLA